MTMHSEILEQPTILGTLYEQQYKVVEEIAERIRRTDIRFVFLAARGTSDNAGRYANYLLGAMNRLPLALATPSLFTLYQQPPLLRNALVIGISQSGMSPDIVSVMNEARKQGNLTLAITNAVNSPLASASDLVLDIKAGEEKAVAATKTYTAELMTVAMLSAALRQDVGMSRQLEKIASWAAEALELDGYIQDATRFYRYMPRCAVLGRGYNYATAYEWALKMKEAAYVGAEPYSSADFLHGPIALLEPGFPVFLIAPSGKVYENMLTIARLLRDKLNTEMAVVSDQKEILGMARTAIQLPASVPEWLSPIISVIPGQCFAYHLTVHRGYDPEKPRTIQKVTETE